MSVGAPAARDVRRGRPPGTSRRALELIALRLFTEQGFEETTIDQIAAEAGISRRGFFRYFDSKAGGAVGRVRHRGGRDPRHARSRSRRACR